MKCIHYAGNQFCKLHQSKVASAYCGDICEEDKEGNCYDPSDFTSKKDVLDVNPYE